MRSFTSGARAMLFCGLVLVLVGMIPGYGYAGSLDPETARMDRVGILVVQLGVILFAAWLGGQLFRRWRLPEVLGEVIAGTIIGPYLLGGVALFGFPQGVFPLQEFFPISAELYSLATIASILLLFLVGLETDIQKLLRFSGPGVAVGIGGVVISFVFGDLVGVVFSQQLFGVQYGFFDFVPMFLGVVSTATSVGITARILSEKRKMDTPEGVTILSGAVIDDVLGIVILSVVIGVVRHEEIDWRELLLVSGRALGIWIGFTMLGLCFARQLSHFIKSFKDRATMVVMSFALALLLAGVFEKSGMAMIIGAYVMGISFAKTDLAFAILEGLSTLRRFLVPIFFCVMGMLIDVRGMVSSLSVIGIGLVFTLVAVGGKILGCSIPALFFNFNTRGALRIAAGMVPRGEIALIIAGIGLSSGALPEAAFNVSVIMIFLTTLITPPFLSRLLSSPQSGLRDAEKGSEERREEEYAMPNPETAELVLSKIIAAFEGEGFYVNMIETGEKFYQIRKEDTFISMRYAAAAISFRSTAQDMAFVHTLVYEVLADLQRVITHLQLISEKDAIGRKIFEPEEGAAESVHVRNGFKFQSVIHPLSVSVSLSGNSKKEIISELVDLLVVSGQLPQEHRSGVFKAVMEREETMSTGMQDGIALPHAKTDEVAQIICAVGVKKRGVDFSSLDNQPARIFVLTLAPRQSNEPYLQFMAEMSKVLANDEHRLKLLHCRTNEEFFRLLIGK